MQGCKIRSGLRSLQVFKAIGGEQWSSVGELRKCIGNPDSDKPSDILDKEMADQRGDSTVRAQQLYPCLLSVPRLPLASNC